MIGKLTRREPAAFRFEVVEVPVCDCVHYTGFRYGNGRANPLENSAHDLYHGVPLLEVRRRFVEFLRYYRPRGMADALNVQLDHHCPLWAYPWQTLPVAYFAPTHGWFSRPDEVPDIVTHFSDAGILSYRIDQEFFWQEQALQTIVDHGYQPDRYSYVHALELRRRDGSTAYLLLDGNHRVGALSALGHQTLRVQRDQAMIIHEADLPDWPGVKSGRISPKDALALFEGYFHGNTRWRTSTEPAPILGPPDWMNLYLK